MRKGAPQFITIFWNTPCRNYQIDVCTLKQKVFTIVTFVFAINIWFCVSKCAYKYTYIFKICMYLYSHATLLNATLHFCHICSILFSLLLYFVAWVLQIISLVFHSPLLPNMGTWLLAGKLLLSFYAFLFPHVYVCFQYFLIALH